MLELLSIPEKTTRARERIRTIEANLTNQGLRMNDLPVSFPFLLKQLTSLGESLKELSHASNVLDQEKFPNHISTDSIHVFDNIQAKQLNLLQILWSCRGARYALGKNLEDLYKNKEDETTLESNRRLLDLARELDGYFGEIHQLALVPQYNVDACHLTDVGQDNLLALDHGGHNRKTPCSSLTQLVSEDSSLV